MTKKTRAKLRQDTKAISTKPAQTKFSRETLTKASGKAKTERPAIEGNPYAEEVSNLKKQSKYWNDILFIAESEEENAERNRFWDEVESRTEALCDKYAWAIPDERSLSILSHFSPLVEIGAGKGYWARLLQERGVDVIAFDKFILDKNALWTDVGKGDPSTLSKPSARGRNLFLCYPDEQESMASTCLEHFDGEYVIHVGETIFTGTKMAPPVAPFGRTSSADFQVTLAETFHCVLVARLALTYPISSDCISVWKRTKFVKAREPRPATQPSPPTAIEAGTKKSSDNKADKRKKSSKTASAEEEGGVEYVDLNDLAKLREAALDLQYQEDDEGVWANIPEEEVLPVDRAATQFQHLLAPSTSSSNSTAAGTKGSSVK